MTILLIYLMKEEGKIFALLFNEDNVKYHNHIKKISKIIENSLNRKSTTVKSLNSTDLKVRLI